MEEATGKIKLAYVVKYYWPMPRLSGILRFVQELIAELDRDYDIRVFTYRYSPDVAPEEEYRNHRIERISSPFPLKAGAAIGKWEPDLIVFGSGFWRPYLLLPYWKLFRLGLKSRPAPVVLTQYTTMTGKMSGLLKRLRPRPDRVIVTTEGLKEQWEEYYPGRVSRIPPGMRIPEKRDFDPDAVKKKKALRIGFFGHLQPHKGPDILLKVFQEIAPGNAELLINGVGPLEKELREKARGREDIIIQGYVPDIDPWLASCDLVVMPYRSSVSVLGYSRAALDALAMGIPVIGTDSPALTPLIDNGVNGSIVKNEAELKKKITELLENPDRLAQLASRAAASVKKFNITNIADQYKSLISDLITVNG